MPPRKKAKAKALRSSSRRIAKNAARPAKLEAGASSTVMSGAPMEDGKDAMELLNNLGSEVDGTLGVVEVDGKIADGSGDIKTVVGEVNCEGLLKDDQEDQVEKITKKKIIRSRKRTRTLTIMARSTGKLSLKSHDEPTSSYKTKLEGTNEDLKERKNGEDDVNNIENDKKNVAYENTSKEKVEDSGGEKVQVNTKKEVGESSKMKRKRLELKNRKRPLVDGSLVKVASKRHGGSGLSSEKNGLVKAETKGMIFMCSSKTKPDCYRYMVLGFPAPKREIIEKINKGMILFLYDVDKKLLYGTYKAAAQGGYNIEPEAFNSKYPAQIWIAERASRLTRLELRDFASQTVRSLAFGAQELLLGPIE